MLRGRMMLGLGRFEVRSSACCFAMIPYLAGACILPCWLCDRGNAYLKGFVCLGVGLGGEPSMLGVYLLEPHSFFGITSPGSAIHVHYLTQKPRHICVRQLPRRTTARPSSPTTLPRSHQPTALPRTPRMGKMDYGLIIFLCILAAAAVVMLGFSILHCQQTALPLFGGPPNFEEPAEQIAHRRAVRARERERFGDIIGGR